MGIFTSKKIANRAFIAIVLAPLILFVLNFIITRIIISIFISFSNNIENIINYFIYIKYAVMIGVSFWVIYFAVMWVKHGKIKFSIIKMKNDKTTK